MGTAFGASASFQISGSQSTDISRSYTQTFKSHTTVTDTMGPFQPGTIWQWQWVITDGCGTSVFAGSDIVSTKGKWLHPCCLPGYFKDPTKPEGKCHPGRDNKLYDLCADHRASEEAAAAVAIQV